MNLIYKSNSWSGFTTVRRRAMFSYQKRECLICNSSNVGGSHLNFFFSSCCGFVVCQQCMQSSILREDKDVVCKLCLAPLTKDSFDTSDYDMQKVSKEVHLRMRVDKMFVIF